MPRHFTTAVEKGCARNISIDGLKQTNKLQNNTQIRSDESTAQVLVDKFWDLQSLFLPG